MFISSTALLPSTFSMYFTMAFLISWWNKNIKLSIFCVAISTLLGWPFAAVVSLPFLYDTLWKQKKVKYFLIWSFIVAALIGLPLILVDSYFYGKLVFAPLNIITYNIFSSHGPNLYGIESKYFYVINLFLNFNIVWCLAIMYPFLVILGMILLDSKQRVVVRNNFWKISSVYLWMLVFFIQPHKEERFLFPVYPLITLCGSLFITTVQSVSSSRNVKIPDFFIYALKAGFFLLCLARISALYRNYHAPMNIAIELNPSSLDQNVCIGKEWHRFPGSFFAADNNRIRFIPSHFTGILPAYFNETSEGTKMVHQYFNDQNRANDYMLFGLDRCDYLIDFDNGKDFNSTETEPNFTRNGKEWKVEKSVSFLDAPSSHTLFRAFHVPFFGDKFVVFRDYNLLKRI
ncbi:alpha-1,2-mannosyltransferase ALG9 isoform X2 [Uranotaenia lowii]|nr:alpha-1,2-mannosyltransferase ALG9 isoform X2 [Uranotaenia lowii]